MTVGVVRSESSKGVVAPLKVSNMPFEDSGPYQLGSTVIVQFSPSRLRKHRPV